MDENKVYLEARHFEDLHGNAFGWYKSVHVGWHGSIRYREDIGLDLNRLRGKKEVEIIVDPIGLGTYDDAIEALKSVFSDAYNPYKDDRQDWFVARIKLSKPLRDPKGLLLSLGKKMWREIESALEKEAERRYEEMLDIDEDNHKYWFET